MNGKIRLRRAFDNTEKDFNLGDTKAMEEWAHGSDCYIAPGGITNRVPSQFAANQKRLEMK
jgi:hypothetical protein